MRFSTVKRIAIVLVGALLLTTLTSCSFWNSIWSRQERPHVSVDDLLVNDVGPNIPAALYEKAVAYTGEAHTGTGILYLGNRTNQNYKRVIVIDAGHQLRGSEKQEPIGPDSDVTKDEVTWGATGTYTGTAEYELNLQVALLLRDVLIERGYSVVMVRETNNVTISNMERALLANEYNAAAYIRIHANSWTDDSMQGAMTICQSRENPYPTCADHYPESRLLSELVLDSFCSKSGISRLEVREMDNMTGTNWSQVPTTIVEMGFLSNERDDMLMATGQFRRDAAEGIADGLDSYFKQVDSGYFYVPPDETRFETGAEEP